MKQIECSEALDHIKKYINENGNYRLSTAKISVSQDSDEVYRIKFETMYDYVDFDFAFLEMLSLLFETKNINIGDKWHLDGCETCDYGSKYELSVFIHPMKE